MNTCYEENNNNGSIQTGSLIYKRIITLAKN